jgi:hypothetical protein
MSLGSALWGDARAGELYRFLRAIGHCADVRDFPFDP